MEKLKQLIKESFDLWVRSRWLKEIDRAANRLKKAQAKVSTEQYAIKALIQRYNEIYDDPIFVGGKYTDEGRADKEV